jgi:hypothetical protein
MLHKMLRAAVVVAACAAAAMALAQDAPAPISVRPLRQALSPTWSWIDTPTLSPNVRHACRIARSSAATYRLCVEGRRAGEFMLVLSEMRDGDSIDVSSVSLYSYPDLALALMSDRRFSHFWPVLRTVGGADALQFRSGSLRAMLRDARIPPIQPTTFDSTISARMRRAVAEASVWGWWGERDRALAILDGLLPVPDARGRLTDNQQYDYLAVELRRATLLTSMGDLSGAVHTLRTLSADDRIWANYRINADVNLAALLVEMEQAQEALTLINAAEQRFRAAEGNSSVSGSNRQFAWIRACAQLQLGQEAAAHFTLRAIQATPDVAQNPWVPASQESIVMRSQRCMHNIDGAMLRMTRSILSDAPFPATEWAPLLFDNPRSRVQSWTLRLRAEATAPGGPAQDFVGLPAEWVWLANDRGRYRDATVQ